MQTAPQNPDHALVLFSGGQDSTTCLAWALARYAYVETIGFAYGQRHAVELDCREPIRNAVVKLPVAKLQQLAQPDGELRAQVLVRSRAGK